MIFTLTLQMEWDIRKQELRLKSQITEYTSSGQHLMCGAFNVGSVVPNRLSRCLAVLTVISFLFLLFKI